MIGITTAPNGRRTTTLHSSFPAGCRPDSESVELFGDDLLRVPEVIERIAYVGLTRSGRKGLLKVLLGLLHELVATGAWQPSSRRA
jgi:hypothetical protein